MEVGRRRGTGTATLLPLFLQNKGERSQHSGEEQAPASVNVKHWLMIIGRIGTNDHLLGLRTDLSLESGEYYTCATTYHSLVSKGPALPGLTGVILFATP